jgi:hypothetical protein
MLGTVTILSDGRSGTMEMLAAKPNLSRLKVAMRGSAEMSEGFDGVHYWSVIPGTGPILATGRELEEKKFDYDFFSDLHDPRATRRSQPSGEPSSRAGLLKLRLMRKDGSEDIEFYDVGSVGFRQALVDNPATGLCRRWSKLSSV